MSLDLIDKFKELKKIGIIKDFKVMNGQLDFESDIPLSKILKEIDKYLYKNYGLNFNILEIEEQFCS